MIKESCETQILLEALILCKLEKLCWPQTSFPCIAYYKSNSNSDFSSVQFSHSVVFDSLRPHGLQNARPPCPSPTPGAYSNSCSSHWWYHPTNSSSVIPFCCLQSFPSSESFLVSKLFESVAKVLEFQLQHRSFQWIFRTDFLDDGLVWSLCSPRDSQESPPAPQFKSISSPVFRLLHGTTLTTVPDYWKKHSFDYMDLCWQKAV